MNLLKLRISQTLLAFTLSVLLLSVADAVNINTANVHDIAEGLQGIGTKKAQAIVTWRENNGQFKTQDDLNHVNGIGLKTIEKNKNNIQL